MEQDPSKEYQNTLSSQEKNGIVSIQPRSIHIDKNADSDANGDKNLLEIREEAVSHLLNAVSNPKLNERDISTSLHFAAENSHPKIIKILLEDPRINPNLLVDQRTALHVAIQKNSYPCVELLLQFGANQNIQNSRGQTGLHLAAEAQQKDLAHLILNQSKVSVDLDISGDDNKRTAREVLAERFPDLQLPERKTAKTSDFDALRDHLKSDKEPEFCKLLETADLLKMNEIEYLVRIAAGEGLTLASTSLLKYKKASFVYMTDIVDTALENGSFQVLKTLLDHNVLMRDDYDLLLRSSKLLGVPCQAENNYPGTRLECFKLILKHKGVPIRYEYYKVAKKEDNPMYYADMLGCIEAVNLLTATGRFNWHMDYIAANAIVQNTSNSCDVDDACCDCCCCDDNCCDADCCDACCCDAGCCDAGCCDAGCGGCVIL